MAKGVEKKVEDDNVDKFINHLCDKVYCAFIVPPNGIINQDKEVIQKFISPNTSLKIICGEYKGVPSRMITTSNALHLTDNVISILDKLINTSSNIFRETITTDNANNESNVINPNILGEKPVTKRSFAIYTLQRVVVARFELSYFENGTISNLQIDTRYTALDPDNTTSRIIILTTGTNTAVRLFKEFLEANKEFLDTFSRGVIAVMENEKFVGPGDKITSTIPQVKNNKNTPQVNDPSFF